jgi:rare lipoprotein A (peptidoglycan hydrolase)
MRGSYISSNACIRRQFSDIHQRARQLSKTQRDALGDKQAGWFVCQLLEDEPEAKDKMGMTSRITKSFLVLSILALPSCMTVPKGLGNYDVGYAERGIASWYGGYFHGRPTASGAIYDQFEMTAAHRLLPLGSVVRVTNAENGRQVKVVINDRGPFIKGRIIDLSYAAAQRLGAVEPGTLPVLVEVIQVGDRATNHSSGRLTGPEDNFDVGLSTSLLGQYRDPQEDEVRLCAIGSRAGLMNRGPMDVLRDPRRARRLAEAEGTDEHPDHAELIEQMAEAVA